MNITDMTKFLQTLIQSGHLMKLRARMEDALA